VLLGVVGDRRWNGGVTRRHHRSHGRVTSRELHGRIRGRPAKQHSDNERRWTSIESCRVEDMREVKDGGESHASTTTRSPY
jgi:hypothetical protein